MSARIASEKMNALPLLTGPRKGGACPATSLVCSEQQLVRPRRPMDGAPTAGDFKRAPRWLACGTTL
eukprot:8601807-Pyramimonas_sp.AAC.1